MSKEIKFRAWHPQSKQMLHFSEWGFCIEYGQLTFQVQEEKFQGIANMPDEAWEEGEWVLMQSTGFKDKNGKEIYEGDMVRYKCAGMGKEGVAEIHTLSPTQGFFVNIPGDPTNGDVFLEVIGNIYENQELLES